MLPAPHPCGGAAAPAGWLSPSGITKSAPVPRFRRPKHSSFCRVIVAARARSTSLQLPILDCRLYFTGQHRKNQYFFAGPHNFFAARLRCCICLQQGELRAPERGSLLAAVTCRLFSSMSPAAPFLPAAEEMGERTPPKTHGLWNSFRPISMRWEKVPQGIDREPTLATADMVGGGYWRDYRFRRLSNRALAAVSGKCRCGLMGRHFTLVEQSAAVRDVGAAAI